uniref:alpha-1,2-Mannosidase n=1 Tax=Eutreptiella gymnastica TaxID=73025 RepID=A0A7S4FFU4_9EUGL
MSTARRWELAEEVKEMFYHSYAGYMKYAFPKDELKPVSCTGVDNWGGLSLTLVDSLDMLVVLGNITEFRNVVRYLGQSLNFNKKRAMSLFELNIRALGGLLSGHHFAEQLLPEYDGVLLRKSVELADILLTAFDSPTGIPFNEVTPDGPNHKETTNCPAAAGTLLLEFGYLSTLTGNCKYLMAARGALDALWAARSTLNLWGTVIDVNKGNWQVTDADIGASIDSLYEYLFKSYLLFGDDRYLRIFEDAYGGAERHLKRDNWYIKVDMHTGGNEKRHVNSLQAFWPGLQVLAGLVPDAMASWNRFHCLEHKFGFMPERYSLNTGDLMEKGYPLRPEFLESTAFLFEVTGNHKYLEIGENAVRKLQRLARTRCGFGAVVDVTSGKLEDKMETFFLSETLKYLYLMFVPEEPLNISSRYIFNTEAHPLPITLDNHRMHNKCTDPRLVQACADWNKRMDAMGAGPEGTIKPRRRRSKRAADGSTRPRYTLDEVCVRQQRNDLTKRRPARNNYNTAYAPQGQCPVTSVLDAEFGFQEPDLGTCFQKSPPKGTAASMCPRDSAPQKTVFQVPAGDGKMLEMQFLSSGSDVQLTKVNGGVILHGVDINELHVANLPFSVKAFVMDKFGRRKEEQLQEIMCSTAQFGASLAYARNEVRRTQLWYPSAGRDGCTPVTEAPQTHFSNKFVVMFDRGVCPFQRKIEHGQAAGAVAVIIANNQDDGMVHMAPDVDSTNASLVTIPSVFVSRKDAVILRERLQNPDDLVVVTLGRSSPSVFRNLGLEVQSLSSGNILIKHLSATPTSSEISAPAAVAAPPEPADSAQTAEAAEAVNAVDPANVEGSAPSDQDQPASKGIDEAIQERFAQYHADQRKKSGQDEGQGETTPGG